MAGAQTPIYIEMASLPHLFWPFARSFLPVSSPESSSSLASSREAGTATGITRGVGGE